MEIKLLEIRDKGTCFVALCIDMNRTPPADNTKETKPEDLADFKQALNERLIEYRALRDYGFPCDGRPNIAMCHLAMPGHNIMTNDLYEWGDRTRRNAHGYIEEHWTELKTGDVVDVEFILGESAAPKLPERLNLDQTHSEPG